MRTFKVLVLLASIFFLGMLGNRQAAAQDNGLDLNAYCIRHGFVGALLIGPSVYDWYCQDVDEASYSISMDNACYEQYGQGWTPGYVAYDQPYSWHCQYWCMITPKVGRFAWYNTKPRPSLRILGPEPMTTDFDAGKEYRIYFKNQLIKPGIWVNHTGYAYGITQWEINRDWARSHGGWINRENWRIAYRNGKGTCPYTASFKVKPGWPQS